MESARLLRAVPNCRHETLFVTPRSGWHNLSCHSSTPRTRRWVQINYCGCDIKIQSIIEVSNGSDIHVVSDEHASAWEDLFIPSLSSHMDLHKAPTEVAPSTPVPHEGETHQFLKHRTLILIRETHLRKVLPLEWQLRLNQRRG